MPNRFIFLSLLMLTVLLQVFCEYSGNAALAGIFNIATVFALCVFLAVKTRLKGRFQKRIFSALLVVAAGLIYFFFNVKYTGIKSSLFFYMMPQVLFIRAFYLDFKSAPSLDKKGARLAILVTFIISLSYYILIRSTLGILRLPVIIGLFCSSFLVMMACFRNMRVNRITFNLVLGGVVILIIAEAFMAYHTFAQPLMLNNLIYSIGSVCGYVLIVWGTLERKLLHPEGLV